MVSLESRDSGSGVCKKDTEKRYKPPILKGTETKTDDWLLSSIPQEQAGLVADQNLCLRWKPSGH